MLRQTFCHLQGIGPKIERGFWRRGIQVWDDVTAADGIDLSANRKTRIQDQLKQSVSNLAKGNSAYFANTLATKHHWRMFQEFRDSVAYLDIETTGLDYYAHHITTIAIYDGKTIRHYVRGHNLNDFANDITNYKLLITYNGKCFDVPFIENAFGITLNQAHIDLRYVLRSLGYSGGLKGCERQLGIDRDDLDGIDGYFAVVLWCEYEQYKNHQALDTLLAYNIQDVLNLETLMTIAYNTNLKYTPFYNELILSDPNQPRNPFSADKKTVKRLMRKYSWLTY